MFSKSEFKIELLKDDYSSEIYSLSNGVNSFKGNTIEVDFKTSNGVNDVKAKVDLANGYLGYSFIYNFDFDDLLNICSFFAPSAYYGDIHNPTKLFFANGRAGAGVDKISAPIMCFFNNGVGYILKDLTPGRRDTIAEDCGFQYKTNRYLVSPNFDLPGLGVIEKEGKVTLQYRYPAHTYNCIEPNQDLYRFSSSKEARFSFTMFSKKAENYDEFCKNAWRDEFDLREKISNGVDTQEAINVAIKYTCDGLGERNGHKEFCLNMDHFTRESGFLYRNTDLAEILLEFKYKGFNVPLSEEQLIEVIDDQVDNEFCGKNQMWPFARSRVEGVYAVLHAYLLLKEHGFEKPNWIKLVLSEADLVLENDDHFCIPLLVDVFNYSKDSKYLDAAIRKGTLLWDKKLSKNNFSGGITDFIGAAPLDKETGLLATTMYVRLYEATKDSKYLQWAKKCADYAETYTQLCNINLEPKEYDDSASYGHMGHGNAHVNSQGLSYVSNTCAVGDLANMFGLFDFVKLAEYTGDKHYLEYAQFVYLNSFNIMYLDDKSGGMDDFLFNAGYGFAPEYVALAGSIDGACNGRGRMHDSSLGWVVYGYLSTGLLFETSQYKPQNKEENRYKVIKVDSIESLPSEFSPRNLLEGSRKVFFDAGVARNITLRFNEITHVDKLVISFFDCNVEATYSIEVNCTYITRIATKRVHLSGYYDVVELNEDVTSIRIIFEKKDNLYISGIIPFGITKNELNPNVQSELETFTKRYIKDDISYFVGDKQIPFNDRSGSYLEDHIEFLRGNLARVYDRTGFVRFDLKTKKSLFYFKKCNNEPCLGEVIVTLSLNGVEIKKEKILDSTSYIEVDGEGQIEIKFEAVNKNSIEFGYLEKKKEF